METVSAGLLMYNQDGDELRVLLAHPGGPYFAKKDEGAWSIPKGLVDVDSEQLLAAARREFEEETGYQISLITDCLPLDTVKLKSGKLVYAWAFAGRWQEGRVPTSNTFQIEWPPGSDNLRSYPEIDRAEMFEIETARTKINPAQIPFLDRLVEHLTPENDD